MNASLSLSIYIYICVCVYYITLYSIRLYYITLYYVILHYITLYYMIFHDFTLYYMILHYITLHYIILHYSIYPLYYIYNYTNVLHVGQFPEETITVWEVVIPFCLVGGPLPSLAVAPSWSR